MAQPVWVTPAGSLGTIPEGVFYQTPLVAVEPELEGTVFYQLLAGNLPAGMQIQQTGLLLGIPQAVANIQGVPAQVSRDVTSKFTVRAFTETVPPRIRDRTFELTVNGQDVPQWITPPGQIAQFFDGTLVRNLAVEYTDVDPDDVVTVKLIAGELPPGLTISEKGIISGFILPTAPIDATAGYGRDRQGYDVYPFDFTTRSINKNFEFVLEVSDGKVGGSSLRTFSIFIWSRSLMSADTTEVTADNTFVTADTVDYYTPVIINEPGLIAQARNDNWFAYKFNAIDLDDTAVQYTITSSSPAPLSSIGLTLDLNTGWLYGYIPNLGVTSLIYTFTVVAFQREDYANRSDPVTFALEIIGPIDSEIIWDTPSDLGSIFNGSTSMFYVKATNVGGLELQYRLLSGSDSNLPQGLQLLPSGEIAGRVSFNTFALDSGTTTFDVTRENGADPTTFDMKHTFTVNAYSSNGLVNVSKTFSITVIREYNEPYQNLYIQAMPPLDDRVLISGLLQNSDIFNPEYLYRPQDPYFGVAKAVVYNHAFGLTASTQEEYYSALFENHYLKTLVLGEIETAQATDSAGNVIYEVVYSRVVDNLVNNEGQSVDKEVLLPFPVDDKDSVFPNSLVNMRDQVIDTVGQVSNILPLWMLSKQKNGAVLGFTPAWVLAYTKPGRAEQIAYYIKTQFGSQLNLVDFEVDRYEVDEFLTKHWNPVTDQWVPSPPTLTTFDSGSTYATFGNYNFDFTVFTPVGWVNDSDQQIYWSNNWNGLPTFFDGGSLQFIDPVDMYVGTESNAQIYDKYLVFPKRNILE